MFFLALRLSLCNLIQRPVSRILVILTVASLMVLLCTVHSFFKAVTQTLIDVKASYFITAYLDSSIPSVREKEILSAVQKIPGVSSVQLVSQDAFIKNLTKLISMNQEWNSLDTASIPRYIKIRSSGEPKKIQESLKKFSGLEFIDINKNKYEGLVGALVTLRNLSILLALGLFIAFICVLFNHFKLGTTLTIQVQRTLYVLGAKRQHRVMPFFFEGAFEGFMGGLLAVLGLFLVNGWIERSLLQLFLKMGYFNSSPIGIAMNGIDIVILLVLMTLAGSLVSVWAIFHKA